jgi:hypothetical protein
MFGQQYGQEFDPNRLLSLVVPQLRSQRQQRNANIGGFTRTRGLSGGQEAELFSRGNEADAGAMADASLRAEEEVARASNRERLINEGYQFQVKSAEEQRKNQQADQLANLFAQGAGAIGSIATGAIGAPPIYDIYKAATGGGGGPAPAAPNVPPPDQLEAWLQSLYAQQ